MDTIQFENIEKKLDEVLKSDMYAELIEKVKKAEQIYLIGNGGLHFVASHMATDLSRLIPDKVVRTFDNIGFITSTSNDWGFENLFTRWLELTAKVTSAPDKTLIVGLSCSGNSTNVINAMHWAHENNYEPFMITGQKSAALDAKVAELVLNCEYFHTVEVLTMMVLYDVIHKTGNHCPSIGEEKDRLSLSSLRKT